jgi:hypothetical protein
VVRDDQPDTREGQAGRRGDAERFVVPLKPGNAGGGKGDLSSRLTQDSEGPGDWATYQLRRVCRNCRWRCTRKRRQKLATASTPCMTRSAARTSYAQCRSNKDASDVDGGPSETEHPDHSAGLGDSITSSTQDFRYRPILSPSNTFEHRSGLAGIDGFEALGERAVDLSEFIVGFLSSIALCQKAREPCTGLAGEARGYFELASSSWRAGGSIPPPPGYRLPGQDRSRTGEDWHRSNAPHCTRR